MIIYKHLWVVILIESFEADYIKLPLLITLRALGWLHGDDIFFQILVIFDVFCN